MNKSRNNLIQLSEQLFFNRDQIGMTPKKRAKEPSIISLLFLVFVTLSLYSFGIYQLSNSVSNFVDTIIQKVEQY